MLTSIAMIAGVMIIAMPIAVVGDNFKEAWDARTLSLVSERLRQKSASHRCRTTHRACRRWPHTARTGESRAHTHTF
eukprot:4554722-Prymnesium_polylepis.1